MDFIRKKLSVLVNSVNEEDEFTRAILFELLAAGITLGSLWIGIRMFRSVLGSAFSDHASLSPERKAQQNEILARLRARGVPPENLVGITPYEESILAEVVFPEWIESGFSEIGGLEHIKTSIREIIMYPLTMPHLFQQNALLTPVKGALFYGPPGTGKTMMAKAIAKESGANFINLSPSSLLSKFVGETNQLTRAVFTIATRISPCIIFIDEIDALFRERTSGDHECYRDMKAEFMQLWDGLITDSSTMVMILGATNRPWDIDPAILRRMPRSFEIGLPSYEERVNIIKALTKSSELDPDFNHEQIAEITVDYSGSDLKELLRAASLGPLREAMKEERNGVSLRPLTTKDVILALQEVVPTIQQSSDYRSATAPTLPISDSNDASRALLELLVRALSQGANQRDLFAESTQQSYM